MQGLGATNYFTDSIGGLISGGRYYYEAVCRNYAGTARGGVWSFVTSNPSTGAKVVNGSPTNSSGNNGSTYSSPPATTAGNTGTSSNATATPIVTTGISTTDPSGTLVMKGTVDPRGSDTTCWFDWGSATSGVVSSPHRSYGSVYGAVPVTEVLTGVSAGKYTYRLICQNSYGTIFGASNSVSVIRDAVSTTSPSNTNTSSNTSIKTSSSTTKSSTLISSTKNTNTTTASTDSTAVSNAYRDLALICKDFASKTASPVTAGTTDETNGTSGMGSDAKENSSSTQSASAADATDSHFLPTTLVGWLLLALAIFGVIYVIRLIHEKNEERKKKKENPEVKLV